MKKMKIEKKIRSFELWVRDIERDKIKKERQQEKKLSSLQAQLWKCVCVSVCVLVCLLHVFRLWTSMTMYPCMHLCYVADEIMDCQRSSCNAMCHAEPEVDDRKSLYIIVYFFLFRSLASLLLLIFSILCASWTKKIYAKMKWILNNRA